jgi:hypothetical protein
MAAFDAGHEKRQIIYQTVPEAHSLVVTGVRDVRSAHQDHHAE